MLKNIIRFILGFGGMALGYYVATILKIADKLNFSDLSTLNTWIIEPANLLSVIIGFLFGFFLISYLVEKLLQLIINFENRLKEVSWKKMIIGISGLAFGLLFGILVNLAFSRVLDNGIGMYFGILINLIFAYLGFTIFLSKEKEIIRLVDRKSSGTENLYDGVVSNKILDTSVIIDGRIADISKSGFLEGTLIIPEFVLEELRHIADSSESLKRNRGRRGLDILKQMQKEPYITVEIINQDFDDIQEVDSKLVKLAQVMGARIVTNDYNLNKVAELQGVKVLNINELANSVKPIVLPGEEMDVKVIKEGKEDGQGVAYLDDGTMIVVDEGIKYMNQRISVLVTSILQTAAGRMIFAKPKASKQIV